MQYLKSISIQRIVAIFMFSVCVPSQAEDVVNIDMFVGEVRSLGSQPVSRIAVGAGKVLRANVVSGGELLVIAEGKGSSYLKLWYEDGTHADYNRSRQ